MPLFHERLGAFLTECKIDALRELSGHKVYDGWRKECAELCGSLNKLPPEFAELFKRYQETVNAISGMESDYCYLCGIRDYLSISKHFTSNSAEWERLASLICDV